MIVDNIRFPCYAIGLKDSRNVVELHDITCAVTHSSHITTMNGVIKKLTDRGFGFITPEGGAKDLFFHSKSLVGVEFDSLREGDAVTFDEEMSDKGPNAVNVQLAPKA